MSGLDGLECISLASNILPTMSISILKPYMLVAFSHLLPFFMYVFLGFSLALSGEVGMASILSYIVLIHGAALSLLVLSMISIGSGNINMASKIAKVLVFIDLFTATPCLIRLIILYLLSLARPASYISMNLGTMALYMLPRALEVSTEREGLYD